MWWWRKDWNESYTQIQKGISANSIQWDLVMQKIFLKPLFKHVVDRSLKNHCIVFKETFTLNLSNLVFSVLLPATWAPLWEHLPWVIWRNPLVIQCFRWTIRSKEIQEEVTWGMAFSFWHGFSLLKIGKFPLLCFTGGFKFSQAMGNFYNPVDYSWNHTYSVEPRNQVSHNREMLAGNHTEWNYNSHQWQ